MTAERRHYSRIAFRSPGRLVFTDCSIEVVVVDLSLKGALIRLPANTLIENDAICMLHVRLNKKNDQIIMECSVAHVEGRQAGLVCLTIDLDSVTHLRRLVELNLGDLQLLERELSALIAE
jgi:hypothetical protein